MFLSLYPVLKNSASRPELLLQPWDPPPLLSHLLFRQQVSLCAASLLLALPRAALPADAASPLPAAASRTKCPHQPKLNRNKKFVSNKVIYNCNHVDERLTKCLQTQKSEPCTAQHRTTQRLSNYAEVYFVSYYKQ